MIFDFFEQGDPVAKDLMELQLREIDKYVAWFKARGATRMSVARLAELLNDRIGDLAVELLGTPNRALSSAQQLRFGQDQLDFFSRGAAARGAGGGAAAPGTTAPAGTPGAAGTRPAPVMNEIEREQMMLQMQRAISSTISGQLSSVVSTLESFTLPVTAETKADIKELSSKLKALAADVKNIGADVRKIVPAPVKKD